MQRAGFVCRPCLAAMRQREAALRLPIRSSRQFATKTKPDATRIDEGDFSRLFHGGLEKGKSARPQQSREPREPPGPSELPPEPLYRTVAAPLLPKEKKDPPRPKKDWRGAEPAPKPVYKRLTYALKSPYHREKRVVMKPVRLDAGKPGKSWEAPVAPSREVLKGLRDSYPEIDKDKRIRLEILEQLGQNLNDRPQDYLQQLGLGGQTYLSEDPEFDAPEEPRLEGEEPHLTGENPQLEGPDDHGNAQPQTLLTTAGTAGSETTLKRPDPQGRKKRLPTLGPIGTISPLLTKKLPMDRNLQFKHLQETVPPEQLPQAARRFRIWKKDFSQAWGHQLLNHSLSMTGHIIPKPKDSGEEHLRALLLAGEVDAMRERWQKRSLDARIKTWPHVMADCLTLAPHEAHKVLEATFDPDVVPFYAVRDTISFLVKRYHLLARAGPTEYGKVLPGLLIQILRESSEGFVKFTQHSLYTISQVAEPDLLLDLYAELRIYKHHIKAFTKLHFIAGVAKHAEYKRHAVEIFRDLIQEHDIVLQSAPVMAACTSMLAFTEKDAKDTALSETRAYILEELTSLGIQPNLITFTAIIRNLSLAHDFRNAMQVFDLVQSHRISPDLHLYSILLNGCKYSGDFKTMGKLISQLVKDHDCRDPVIWNDVIHSIHYIYSVNIEHFRPTGPWGIRVIPAFPPMLQVFAKVFNMEPLQRLLPMHNLDELLEDARNPNTATLTQGPWNAKVAGLLNIVEQLEPKHIEPTPWTLAIMLSGFLRSQSSVYPVVSFYASFRRMIATGAPEATFITQYTTAVHDNVIRYLGRWPGMLRVALDVVNDMLDDAKRDSRVEGVPAATAATAVSKFHPAPSIYTWTILLNALVHNRQLEQAERLMKVMRNHGVEPTRVTWNALIAGYARTQSVPGTVSALQRAERAGWPQDEFTLRAFSLLTHQEEALSLMEEMVERREQMLTGKSASDEFEQLQLELQGISTALKESPRIWKKGPKEWEVDPWLSDSRDPHAPRTWKKVTGKPKDWDTPSMTNMPDMNQLALNRWLPYDPQGHDYSVVIGGTPTEREEGHHAEKETPSRRSDKFREAQKTERKWAKLRLELESEQASGSKPEE